MGPWPPPPSPGLPEQNDPPCQWTPEAPNPLLGWESCGDARRQGEELENPGPRGGAHLQRDWFSQSSRAGWQAMHA